jgi:phage shock protein A
LACVSLGLTFCRFDKALARGLIPEAQERRHAIIMNIMQRGHRRSPPPSPPSRDPPRDSSRDPRDELIEHLLKENQKLRAERDELQTALRIQGEELDKKKCEIDALSQSAEQLKSQNILLRTQNAELKEQLKNQEDRISALGMIFLFRTLTLRRGNCV